MLYIQFVLTLSISYDIACCVSDSNLQEAYTLKFLFQMFLSGFTLRITSHRTAFVDFIIINVISLFLIEKQSILINMTGCALLVTDQLYASSN